MYDKNGKGMVDKEGNVTMDDAAGFFANVFGGERFNDYIGEISIMKEMTSTAAAMMTEEEKAEVERQLNPDKFPEAPKNLAATAHVDKPATAEGSSLSPDSKAGSKAPSITGSTSAAALAEEREKDRLRKLEQREKLREQEKKRREAMEQRVADLTKKTIERIRPFVEANNPGAKDDPETQAFEKRMIREAEDLKLESFGVEVGDHQSESGLGFNVFSAPSYDRHGVHDEGIVLPQVPQVPGHVSATLTCWSLLLT